MLIETLEAMGVKITPTRVAVAIVLDDAEKRGQHLDAETIETRCCGSVSTATVYRALRLFSEMGIIREHDFFGDGRNHYEIDKDDGHGHLVNVKTGAIFNVDATAYLTAARETAETHGLKPVGLKLLIEAV